MPAKVIPFPHHRARAGPPGAAAGVCAACAPSGVPGWVAVHVPPRQPDNPYDHPITAMRPCRSCNLDQWRRWRNRCLRRPQPQERR